MEMGRGGGGRTFYPLDIVSKKIAYLSDMLIPINSNAPKYRPLPNYVDDSSEAEILAIFGPGGFLTEEGSNASNMYFVGLILDCTLFHAEAGRQESDSGVIET